MVVCGCSENRPGPQQGSDQKVRVGNPDEDRDNEQPVPDDLELKEARSAADEFLERLSSGKLHDDEHSLPVSQKARQDYQSLSIKSLEKAGGGRYTLKVTMVGSSWDALFSMTLVKEKNQWMVREFSGPVNSNSAVPGAPIIP